VHCKDEGVLEARLASVYCAMPLLVQATLVAPGDSQQYEVVFEREQHHHLLWAERGRSIEFQSGALQALQREIAARYGFQLDGRASELHGRCKFSCDSAARQLADFGLCPLRLPLMRLPVHSLASSAVVLRSVRESLVGVTWAGSSVASRVSCLTEH
jgi:hypothetical protein